VALAEFDQKATGHLMSVRTARGLSVVVGLFLFVLAPITLPSQAQSDAWASPTIFFNVEERGSVQSPILLSDSGGNLHAFWGAAMTEGQPMALYQSRLQDDAWTEPVDVLLSPDGGDVWPFSAHVDEHDYAHVFWSSGGRLWHSMAHVSHLSDARQWSQPVMVPTDQETFTAIAVAQDENGVLYLVYGNRALDTISLLKSEDGANSWIPISTVYRSASTETWVGYPGIVVAPNGALWVSWREMEPGSGRSKGLAYARSEDGGATWSAQEQLIAGYYFGGFEAVGDVMVKKYGGGIGTGGRFVSFSEDSGSSWTEPLNISSGDGEGAQGIGLVVDSAEVWHFIVETGMTFARVAWDRENWLPPEFVVPRDLMQVCCTTPGKVTENAAVGISDGNRIHVFFEQDNSILWYTSRELDAPRLVPQPPSSPQAAQIDSKAADVAVGTPMETPTPMVASTSAPWRGDSRTPTASSMTLPLLLALAPVLLIIGTVVVLQIGRRRH